jgi:anti-sigma factor RsiW
VTISDETLMAFADGTLPEAEAMRVVAAIEADPALAERVALLAEGREALRGAFAGVLAEAPPARLLAAAGGTAPPVPAAGNDNAPPRWRVAAWAAAASLVLGVMLGTQVPRAPAPGGLLSPAVLAALEGSATGAPGPVQVSGTHVAEGGLVCRAFAAPEQGGTLLGLACREPAGWRLRAAVARGPGSGFQPASGTDPLIAEVLERLGAGPALAAEEEAAARRRGWRAP